MRCFKLVCLWMFSSVRDVLDLPFMCWSFSVVVAVVLLPSVIVESLIDGVCHRVAAGHGRWIALGEAKT